MWRGLVLGVVIWLCGDLALGDAKEGAHTSLHCSKTLLDYLKERGGVRLISTLSVSVSLVTRHKAEESNQE